MDSSKQGIDAQLVSYSVSCEGKTKKLLHNATVNVQPYELCAIVGASGAGKRYVHGCLLHIFTWDVDL